MLLLKKRVLGFLISGESNSGGLGENSELSAVQLEPQPQAQILNNTSLQLEDLRIGVNNLIGHTGLTDNATHGFEQGIAEHLNAVTGQEQCYIVKAGNGGSVLANWGAASGNWSTLTTRFNAVQAVADAENTEIAWVALHTLGINDSIAGTDLATYNAGMITQYGLIRDRIGSSGAIISPRFQQDGTKPLYTKELEKIANTDKRFFLLQSSDAGLEDGNHWNSAGLSLIAQRALKVAAERAFL